MDTNKSNKVQARAQALDNPIPQGARPPAYTDPQLKAKIVTLDKPVTLLIHHVVGGIRRLTFADSYTDVADAAAAIGEYQRRFDDDEGISFAIYSSPPFTVQVEVYEIIIAVSMMKGTVPQDMAFMPIEQVYRYIRDYIDATPIFERHQYWVRRAPSFFAPRDMTFAGVADARVRPGGV